MSINESYTGTGGTRYRILQYGELIHEGDERDECVNPMKDYCNWQPVPFDAIGRPVSDPAFPAHTIYRRRIEEPTE